jgi:hypothetical protein
LPPEGKNPADSIIVGLDRLEVHFMSQQTLVQARGHRLLDLACSDNIDLGKRVLIAPPHELVHDTLATTKKI